MKYILLLGLLISATCFSYEPEDAALHTGVAYAASTIGYGMIKTLCKDNYSPFCLSKTAQVVTSAGLAFIGGTAEEILHARSVGVPADKNDILWYGVGSALSVGVVLTFDF